MKNYEVIVVVRRQACTFGSHNPHDDTAARALIVNSEDQALEILRGSTVRVVAYEPCKSITGRFDLPRWMKAEGIKIPLIALTTCPAIAKEVGANGFIDLRLFFCKMNLKWIHGEHLRVLRSDVALRTVSRPA